jgi:hypothetical protein
VEEIVPVSLEWSQITIKPIPSDFRFPDTARLPTHKVMTFIVQLLCEKVKQQ